jgi:light-regulated signal transduction histidine kinase (bacteriophytochrome)
MLHEIIETIVPAEGYNVLLRILFLNLKFREYYSNKYSNLISNAIKYNDKPTKVECLYESLTDFHQFSIKDNGPGIAEKYHQKYLKFFKQLKPDKKREYRRWVVQ